MDERLRTINRKYKNKIEVLQRKIFDIQKEKIKDHKKIIALNNRVNTLEIENQRLLELSQNDSLTGIPNRRRLDAYLNIEWLRGRREVSNLSLLIIDIDYFKEYNDHYGHVEGDRCIIQVGTTLKKILKRPGDLLARYGGDEFIAVLPNTDSVGALLIAEEMRQGIENLGIMHQHSTVSDFVSVTIGVSTTLPNEQMSSEILVHRADAALYEAKKKGRNQIKAYI